MLNTQRPDLSTKPHAEPKSFRSLNRDGTFNVVPLTRRQRGTFGDLYHSMLVLSWPRFLLGVALVYLSLNLLFGLGYFLCGAPALEGVNRESMLSHFMDSFFFSVQTFATIGYGRISPVGLAPNLLVTLEALVGLMCLSLVTGLLFARFSRPTARIAFSNVAVVNCHDGQISLMMRLANERRNMIAQAMVSMVLVIDERTAEGEAYRSIYDLQLERSISPAFSLSWVIVHPITANSPLHGQTVETLTKANAEILVTVTGIDATLAQTIHARFSYVPGELRWNKRFVDILSRAADGRTQVDMPHFHDVTDV